MEAFERAILCEATVVKDSFTSYKLNLITLFGLSLRKKYHEKAMSLR